MSETTQYVPYKVKDMSLAEWGRHGNQISRGRDARTHGPPRRVRREQATCRGARIAGLFAHDHPNGGID
jgi:hypothetical protein